ncbi:MAG: ADP-glyceromanno-heptose 6-epimerase [Saprospiraceae bacterium]|nr:ADP-glyceromanno-heptose 6-epimerase [Saprospiraceae bacterium]
MIVVTGAAGFIGSCLIRYLNDHRIDSVIGVDEFGRRDKLMNLQNKQLSGLIHREDFHGWLENNHRKIGAVFHLGARTDTTEFDSSVFEKLNLQYSKTIWMACAEFSIPLIYASSAATYGDGALGYDDNHQIVKNLHPLNPYGDSKNLFDLWALEQTKTPPKWYGLKFFNVYGPNEYHKGRMASVIMHAYHQILETGRMRLFRSHRPDVEDGHQSRDFIYVEDIIRICLFCLQAGPPSGLYNAGTGKARTFIDLVNGTFAAMGKKPAIDFINTPIDIIDKYQYFTEANMHKLLSVNYNMKFTELEIGVSDYVKKYLIQRNYY